MEETGQESLDATTEQTTTDEPVDRVKAKGEWAFDDEVTAVFENMLKRSIPQYDIMRKACFDVGSKFVKQGTEIIDIGASRGEAIAPFVQEFGAYNHYTCLEKSEAMFATLKERFRLLSDVGVVSVRCQDLREKVLPGGEVASLVLSVLTLQFIPIEYRQSLVLDIHRTLRPGGALILVEKVLGGSSLLNEIMVGLYLDFKKENRYTDEEIQRKRMSLEGILVPITAAWNEQLLRGAGFHEIDCFWRWMNFAGWVAVK
jgi:tRNA (cmo5U34)-methyltransferase